LDCRVLRLKSCATSLNLLSEEDQARKVLFLFVDSVSWTWNAICEERL